VKFQEGKPTSKSREKGGSVELGGRGGSGRIIIVQSNLVRGGGKESDKGGNTKSEGGRGRKLVEADIDRDSQKECWNKPLGKSTDWGLC